MRRAARTDTNHRELLDLARQLGGYVVDTKSVGKGCPDAFVFIRTQWRAVEIKREKGTLTTAQQTLHAMAPILIWRSRSDVCDAFGAQR
jgi:hypothetical protein